MPTVKAGSAVTARCCQRCGHVEELAEFETQSSLARKLPARGARKPNADEQAGDWE